MLGDEFIALERNTVQVLLHLPTRPKRVPISERPCISNSILRFGVPDDLAIICVQIKMQDVVTFMSVLVSRPMTGDIKSRDTLGFRVNYSGNLEVKKLE